MDLVLVLVTSAVFPVVCLAFVLWMGRIEDTIPTSVARTLRRPDPAPVLRVPVRRPAPPVAVAPTPATTPAMTPVMTPAMTPAPTLVRIPAQRADAAAPAVPRTAAPAVPLAAAPAVPLAAAPAVPLAAAPAVPPAAPVVPITPAAPAAPAGT